MAEKNDRIVMQRGHTVVKSMRCRYCGFSVVVGGFGEARKLSENFMIRLSFKLFPHWIVMGGLINTMRKAELCDLVLMKKTGRIGIPASTAEKNIGRNFGSILQTDLVLFKFSDIITIDLNILGDGLPKVGVLDESQSVIGPENTNAYQLWRSKRTLTEARTDYMVLGFRFLKFASASGLASNFAPSRLTLSAVFQI